MSKVVSHVASQSLFLFYEFLWLWSIHFNQWNEIKGETEKCGKTKWVIFVDIWAPTLTYTSLSSTSIHESKAFHVHFPWKQIQEFSILCIWERGAKEGDDVVARILGALFMY